MKGLIIIFLISNKLIKLFYKYKDNRSLNNIYNASVGIGLMLRTYIDSSFSKSEDYEDFMLSRNLLMISLPEEVDEKFNNFNNIKCNSVEECEEVLKIIIELIEKKEFVKSFFCKNN